MRRILKNANVRKRCHICTMLEKQSKKHCSFHTPGHKQAGWDITELAYSDNLASPRGVIQCAQGDIAAVLGANKSFLMTDGSTSGVLSMLHAARSMGVKTVAASEASHKSLYNGCALLGIELLLLPMQTRDSIPQNVTEQALEEHAALLQKADAIFLTSPDYYGNVAPLAALRRYCNAHNKILLIDGAHGGHLHADKALYAGAYADIWVDGVHKSLPALTQGAVVSARTEAFAAALGAAVDSFRTTSPSYPIMASVEYAVKYPQNQAVEALVTAWKNTQPRVYKNEDWTKLCCQFGENAFEAEEALLSKGIYPEFCDGNVVCFYLSPALSVRQVKRLIKTVNALFLEYPYQEKKQTQRIPAPAKTQNDAVEWVLLAESENRILAESIGLFPPCIPLRRAGEYMDKESIRLMQQSNNVFGVVDGKIAVYKQI